MRLIVQTGIDAGRKFRLTKSVITIGRDPSNDIVLGDTRVSRRHAEIRRRGKEFVIVDVGSTHGTYVNEELVLAPRALQYGDRVRVGNTILSFQAAPVVQPVSEIAWVPAAKRKPNLLPFLLVIGTVLLAAIFIVLQLPPPPPMPTLVPPTGTPLQPTLTLLPPTATSVWPTPSSCGDGVCGLNEDCNNCMEDCGCKADEYCDEIGICRKINVCGDGICSPEENRNQSCCEDCGCPPGKICNKYIQSCQDKATISEQEVMRIVDDYMTKNQIKGVVVEIADAYYKDKIVKRVYIDCKTRDMPFPCCVILYINDEGEILEELFCS